MLRDRSLTPLSHQHHNGLALCVMTRRSMAQDSTPENLAKLARRIVDRFELELTNHFEIEEQVLFPACGPLPIIAELIREHRDIEAIVSEVRTAPAPEILESFCALLSRHIRREENELFQEIQRTLPPDELERLGREIDARAVRICL